MFGSLAASAKEFGLRFALTGIIPFAFLVAYGFGLAAIAGADVGESLFTALNQSIQRLGAAGAGLLLVAALVGAVITQPFQIAVVRLLEGYWGASSLASNTRNVCVELQRRRTHRLRLSRTKAEMSGAINAANYLTQRLRHYPDVNDLMPTLLGNTLRAGERSAGERYSLDTIASWPRLYYHLPETLSKDIGELHSQVDGGARLTLALGLAGLSGIPILASHGWWNLVWVTVSVLAWISYRGAVNAASDLGTVLATAFDLHRFDMLKGLHITLPMTIPEEQSTNFVLSEFLAGNRDELLAPGSTYQHS